MILCLLIAPRSWLLTLNALTASDKVIVVVSPGYFEVEAIDQIAETIRETKADYNPHLELIGLLFTMTDQTINTSTTLSVLKQLYPTILLPRQIPRNTDIRDAHYNHQDIFSFNPKAYAAIAYEKLIDELFLSQVSNYMKKKLDVAAFTSSLRGESVFFPTKNEQPVPDQAGEPLESQEVSEERPSQETRLQENEETSFLVNKESVKQVSQETSKRATYPKATYQLNPLVTDMLDDAKKIMKRQHNIKVSC